MPRARSAAQPVLSDAVKFLLVTGRPAPRGRFATTWDALLLQENEKRALRRTHRAELAEWERAHPECWAEAKALAAEARRRSQGGRRA